MVPDYDSVTDYAAHLKQATEIHKTLNHSEDDLTEIFVMSSRSAYGYFKLLPVLASSEELAHEDSLFGLHNPKLHSPTSLSPEGRRNLYIAFADQFRSEYLNLLPVADTSKARKTAKRLLRGIKVIICANTAADELAVMERTLSSLNTFDEITPLYQKITGEKIIAGDSIACALQGEAIDDWALWMTDQEEVARGLLIARIPELKQGELRFYDGMQKILLDMLIIDLKDIICQREDVVRRELIESYVDAAAGLTARLALCGVESLSDFEESAPRDVLQSYEILVDHLKNGGSDFHDLAAASIMLEYAFEQSVIEANKRTA